MSSETNNHFVLIVEDNMANLLLARAVMERAGFHVLEAHSADEAKRQLQTIIPNVILMDIGLPGQDGLSLTRELKQAVPTASIPVVALTAGAMRIDQSKAFAAGCDAYISKPFRSQDLVDVVTGLVGAPPIDGPGTQ